MRHPDVEGLRGEPQIRKGTYSRLTCELCHSLRTIPPEANPVAWNCVKCGWVNIREEDQ